MSARLKSAPLTDEDLDIWVTRKMEYCGCFTPGWLRLCAQEFDCFDADVMWNIAQGRQLRIDHPGDPDGDFSGHLFWKADGWERCPRCSRPMRLQLMGTRICDRRSRH